MFGSILHGDVAVGAQQLHRIGILFLAPLACGTWQPVVNSQSLPCPFAELQYVGIMYAQLSGEICAAQPEFTGYLRYIILYIIHAVAGSDCIFVFGMSLRALSASLAHPDVAGLLGSAFYAITREHQPAIICDDIS